MQNLIAKFRKRSVILERSVYLTEKLKTLAAPAATGFNILYTVAT